MKRLTPEEPTGQTAFRLPRSLVKRLDALARRIGKDRGKATTRSEVVRMLLVDSLNTIDMANPEPPKPRKRKHGRK